MKTTYKGWFSVFGDSGQTIQTIFTVIFTILAIGVLLLAVFYSVKAGQKLMSAESAEQRSEAKKQLLWIVIGAGVALLAMIIPTVLWNTIGQYSAVEVPTN